MFRAMILAVVAGAGLLLGVSPAEAGRVPTPGSDVATVGAFSSISYDEDFFGGERANVVVVGDGSTMLQVTVYDENGNYITSATGYTASVTWYPRWTGEFTIRVTNLGAYGNRYVMRSN